MTSSWFFLSTLNYDAWSTTHQICILCIYSTNIGTKYFKHGIYSPFFPLQNAVCFIILSYLVPVLFTFDIQGVLKLKKYFWLQKVKNDGVLHIVTDINRDLMVKTVPYIYIKYQYLAGMTLLSHVTAKLFILLGWMSTTISVFIVFQ